MCSGSPDTPKSVRPITEPRPFASQLKTVVKTFSNKMRDLVVLHITKNWVIAPRPHAVGLPDHPELPSSCHQGVLTSQRFPSSKGLDQS